MKKKNIKEGHLEYDDGYTEEEILDMLLEKADELGVDEDAIGYEVVEMVRNMMAEDGLSIEEAIDKAFDGICNADREYRSDYIWEVLYDMIPCAKDYGLPEPEFDDAEKVAQYIIQNGGTVHGAMYAVLPDYRQAVDREEQEGDDGQPYQINEGTIRKIVSESLKQIMEVKKDIVSQCYVTDADIKNLDEFLTKHRITHKIFTDKEYFGRDKYKGCAIVVEISGDHKRDHEFALRFMINFHFHKQGRYIKDEDPDNKLNYTADYLFVKGTFSQIDKLMDYLQQEENKTYRPCNEILQTKIQGTTTKYHPKRYF